MEKKSFMIEVGNSTTGPLGLVARVRAVTAEEAVEFLKNALPEVVSVDFDYLLEGDIEYIHVYTNADAFTVRDINHEETEDV